MEDTIFKVIQFFEQKIDRRSSKTLSEKHANGKNEKRKQ